jgi:hypothetical protein
MASFDHKEAVLMPISITRQDMPLLAGADGLVWQQDTAAGIQND